MVRKVFPNVVERHGLSAELARQRFLDVGAVLGLRLVAVIGIIRACGHACACARKKPSREFE